MTVAQFVEKFRLLTEVVSSYEAPGLLDVEIYDLLNISQKEIVLELCTARKFDKLYSLITQGEIILTYDGLGVYIGDIDANFFYPVTARVAISRVALTTSGFIPDYAMGNTIVNLKGIDIEHVNSFIGNPFNRNIIQLNPSYWIESKGVLNTPRIKVILDAFTLLGTFTTIASQPNVVLTYIKLPKDFDDLTTSELPENLHEIILSKVVEKRHNALVNNANKN